MTCELRTDSLISLGTVLPSCLVCPFLLLFSLSEFYVLISKSNTSREKRDRDVFQNTCCLFVSIFHAFIPAPTSHIGYTGFSCLDSVYYWQILNWFAFNSQFHVINDSWLFYIIFFMFSFKTNSKQVLHK